MLVIVVAHHAEGKALIEHYRLTQDSRERGGRRFIGDEVTLRIIGQGGSTARRSVAEELAEASRPANLQWLNFGVAGSAQWEVGRLVEVTAVSCDGTDSANSSPADFLLCHRGFAPVTHCLTVAEPAETYPKSGVVDMECHAIAAELEGRSLLNNLSSIKLVIDGPEEPLEKIDPAKIQRLIECSQPHIIGISDKLKRVKPPPFE